MFVEVYPNKANLGMPIFFMLCSDDNESGQVDTTLFPTIKALF
jgi:hypothetical protein